MSKTSTETCSIREPQQDILDMALQKMTQLNGGRLVPIKNRNMTSVYCDKMSHYQYMVGIENNQIVVQGESAQIDKAKQFIEDYYTCMVTSQQFNTPIREVDKEGFPMLTMEVMV